MELPNALSRTTILLLWRILRLPFFIYLGLVGLLAIFQDQLVFQPTVETRLAASKVAGKPGHRFFQVNDHEIHAILIEREHPRCFAVYFHGNGGNITHRRSLLDRISHELNITILGVSYSGYGYSEGVPSANQFHQDADAALPFLCQEYKVNASQIISLGESLGGAVATRLALKHHLPILALDSTFTSLTDVAETHYPWLPVRLLLRHEFNTIQDARHYQGITIQTHGTEDEIIGFEIGKRLAHSFPKEHSFIIRSGGHHNEIPSDQYFSTINDAIDRVFGPLPR